MRILTRKNSEFQNNNNKFSNFPVFIFVIFKFSFGNLFFSKTYWKKATSKYTNSPFITTIPIDQTSIVTGVSGVMRCPWTNNS